jgi:hypothetical protein
VATAKPISFILCSLKATPSFGRTGSIRPKKPKVNGVSTVPLRCRDHAACCLSLRFFSAVTRLFSADLRSSDKASSSAVVRKPPTTPKTVCIMAKVQVPARERQVTSFHLPTPSAVAVAGVPNWSAQTKCLLPSRHSHSINENSETSASPQSRRSGEGQ